MYMVVGFSFSGCFVNFKFYSPFRFLWRIFTICTGVEYKCGGCVLM